MVQILINLFLQIGSTHDENVKIWRVKEKEEEMALKVANKKNHNNSIQSILRSSIDSEEKMQYLYNERNSLREIKHFGTVNLY